MSAPGMTGGAALAAKLKEIAKKAGEANTLRVGFLSGSTYPDKANTPVATVAAIQEFGAPRAGIPPRPFFRSMIAAKSPRWGKDLAAILAHNGYDAPNALALMGERISSQLVESIERMDSPALSPVTLMLRKMRSDDQGLQVTRTTVNEAARRVAAGESYAGVNTAVLVDSGHMKSSIAYQVADGPKTKAGST